MREPIACLGAGRMGRGIAVVFAYAGHDVALVDFKARDAAAFAKLSGEALAEVRNVLRLLARFGLFEEAAADGIAARVSVVAESRAQAALSSALIVFEGVPEVLDLKREALARASTLAGPKPIIASTTSAKKITIVCKPTSRRRRSAISCWPTPERKLNGKNVPRRFKRKSRSCKSRSKARTTGRLKRRSSS